MESKINVRKSRKIRRVFTNRHPKSIFNLFALVSILSLLLSLITGVDRAAADLPSYGIQYMDKSGWSEWIGEKKPNDELDETMYCGDAAVMQFAVETYTHNESTSDDIPAMNSAVKTIILHCGDGRNIISEEHDFDTTTSSSGYGLLSIFRSEEDYDPVQCFDSNALTGAYFTVGGNADGEGDSIQGLRGICHEDGVDSESDSHAGLFLAEGISVYEGVSCKGGHQMQAVRYSMNTKEAEPIISAIKIKCG